MCVAFYESAATCPGTSRRLIEVFSPRSPGEPPTWDRVTTSRMFRTVAITEFACFNPLTLSRPGFCACSLLAPASPRKAFLVPFCPGCLWEYSTNQNPPTAHIFEGLWGVLEGKTSCHSPRRSHFTQNGCCALRAWIFKMAISHSRKEDYLLKHQNRKKKLQGTLDKLSDGIYSF